MAAVTSVQNPLKKEEVLLFYCAPDQQVYLNRYNENGDEAVVRALEADDDSEAADGETSADLTDLGMNFGKPLLGAVPVAPHAPGGEEPPSTKGVVKNPSAFGWVLFDKLLCVYGIRTDGIVCTVSPQFRPLKGSPKAKANSLAACGDGKTGWLYYLGNDPQSVIEYRLSPGASFGKPPKPDTDSQLCAYYNTRERKRYCIYQLDGILHYFEGQGGGMGEITNTQGARPKTPMAICMVKTRNTAYLYYSDTRNRLVRVDYTSEGWGSSRVVPDAQELSDGTRLTVVPNSNESAVLIYYIAAGGEGTFYQLTDYI